MAVKSSAAGLPAPPAQRARARKLARCRQSRVAALVACRLRDARPGVARSSAAVASSLAARSAVDLVGFGQHDLVGNRRLVEELHDSAIAVHEAVPRVDQQQDALQAGAAPQIERRRAGSSAHLASSTPWHSRSPAGRPASAAAEIEEIDLARAPRRVRDARQGACGRSARSTGSICRHWSGRGRPLPASVRAAALLDRRRRRMKRQARANSSRPASSVPPRRGAGLGRIDRGGYGHRFRLPRRRCA